MSLNFHQLQKQKNKKHPFKDIDSFMFIDLKSRVTKNKNERERGEKFYKWL